MTSRSRFRIHNLFHRSKSTGNADAQAEVVEVQEGGTIHSPLLAPPGKSSAQPNQPTQSLTPKDLWSAAYNQLGDEEQRVLSTVQKSTTPSDPENPQTTLVISEVIHLTEKQYENFQQNADKRFRESAHKVINAALSFKDIIGAVAASDPTHHAASAWAIVSLGLTIAQNRYDIRSALFESSEYLADVLAHCAYVEDKFYTNSNGKITGDLGNAMIRLYRAILHYAAQIRTAQDPSMGRRLLDCVTAITEHPLTELKSLVEEERDNIARWIGLVQYLHHEEKAKSILHRIDELHESIKLLTEQFNLVNLSIAKGAFYDSYANQHEGFCLPNTRTRLRSQITDWAESADGKCIFWLKGMAGTGKSTIARTVAQTFKEKQQLGATFFFKKGEADRGDAKYLIPTITKQLVTGHRQLVPGTLEAIKDDPDISSKSLTRQFDKLVLQPLYSLNSSKSTTTIIVIDALDECERKDIPVILELLSQLQESKVLRVRIFLTSRPELPVRLGFKQSDDHQDLDLYELPNPVIEHDIRVFLKERFSMIRKSREMTDHWPGNDTLDTLVMMAVPLFIFAATACLFIEKGRHPERRLKELLEAQAVTSESHMGKIYRPVLTQLLADNEHESKELLQEFRDIVGVIINLATPLSVESLTRLLNLSKRTITEVLDPLHSVLNIPSDPEASVRILHLSFREYLLATETEFHVDEQETHHKIALHCFRLMNDRLKRNICGLPSYAAQRDEIDSQTMIHHLSAVLQYSCRYWVHHLQQSRRCISVFPVLPFLRTHFLHWLEALCLIGVVSEAVGMIDILQALVVNTNTEISNFLYDARRFILRNIFITSTAPLQLYYSGLIFSPKQSVVRKMYSDDIPKWIFPLPQVEATWSSNLQTLTGHSGSVRSVAFSSDGSTLASGSYDKTIKLWDVQTGKELQTLTGHSYLVFSVAFSSDRSTLASGSYNETIKLWDVQTSKELQTLTGYSSLVRSMAFLSDRSTLASGSYNKTIKLWDIQTGKELQILMGHSSSVSSVAFLSDRSILASGSDNKTIKLWDVQTGKELQTLTSYSDSVSSVAFLSDRSTLASGSDDKTVKLWDVQTSKELQTLMGHSYFVSSVAFSSDGSTLASGSYDETIKLWDVQTGKELQTLTGHSYLVSSVAFLSDGSTLASGLYNKTVKLWDIQTSKELRTLTGHSSSVSSVAFLSDRSILASGLYNKTIKLWDVQTGKELQTLTGYSDSVRSVAFLSDRSILASGSDNRTIKLWDVQTGKELQTLMGHSSLVSSVAFSSDESILASGSYNKTIKLWDVQTSKELQTLTGHSDSVRSVAFLSDRSTLASGSDDRTIKLWDIQTGKELQTLTGHSSSVASVAFSSPADGHPSPVLYRNNNLKQSHIDLQLCISGNWIFVAGEKLIYLPPEYRQYNCSAVKGPIIAFGYSDGRVLAIGFHAP